MNIKVRKEFRGLLRKRKKDVHKGDFGHVFVLAGSLGLSGAAVLCSTAVLRSGAGLVTLGLPRSLSLIMSKRLTEVMSCPLPETSVISLSLKSEKEILNKIEKCDVVVLGPGLSQNPETKRLIQKIVPMIGRLMVLDADALNAISGSASILKKIQAPYVITPHPGEMSRLIHRSIGYIKNNRLDVAKKFSDDYNAVVVLKGAGTVITDIDGKFYINDTGNPGMATAGSGDVLTGIIAGFLAQGLELFDAARLGVYVHGLAGDLAAEEKGEIGLIASDILEKVPEAIKLVTGCS